MSIIGKELGQYKILAELGRGGMGIVYKAYQISLNREVALKVLPAALSTDENLVSRFHREAEAAARLSHPNIVQIFDISEIDGVHFFAMEYLKGETLTQKIERQGPLPVKEAVHIAMAVLDALSYSHAEGIIHRDIKPGNIMIDQHGHVKVTDFGLARIMESTRLTMTGTIIGTPEYMSPEQAKGESLDGRSDLYSLGIVLYEALTARIPFEATTPFAVAQKQIYDPLPPPCLLRPEISVTLQEIIVRATQKDPAQRYQMGEDLKKDLEAFISGTGLERVTPTLAVTSATPPIEKGETPNRLFKKIVWGGIASIAILLIVFSFLPNKKERPLQEPEEKPEFIEKKPLEVVAPLAAEKPADEAKKIIDEARRLIDQENYSDAISRLEEVMEKFPEHTQANLIPQWIREIQDKEAGGRFNKAQELAGRGETVQAILEFSQIAKDYPETEWGDKANKKVEGLQRTLEETEAMKEFLEAQELMRENKFIEATQLYQGIISRFPETSLAKKSEEEIARLKEAQDRLREKITQRIGERIEREFRQPEKEPSVREPSPDIGQPPEFKGPPEEARKLVEDIKRKDPGIEKFIMSGDERRLAYYLWTQHRPDLEKIAMAMGVPEGRMRMPFSDMVARYLMGDGRSFKTGRMGMEEKEFRPYDKGMKEDLRPEDEPFEKFRKKAESNRTVQRYIQKGDVEGLWGYLMGKYYKEIKEMSKELNRPFRDMAREVSERLVHERRDER